MEAREEFTRLMAWLVKNSDEVDSDQIQADIMLLHGAAGQLVTKLTERNAALAKQCRPGKSKHPKSSPARRPQNGNAGKSSTDSADTQNDSEDRSKQLSAIQQGIRQADPSLADQQRALRGKVYGAHNDEVALRKAAQAITR